MSRIRRLASLLEEPLLVAGPPYVLGGQANVHYLTGLQSSNSAVLVEPWNAKSYTMWVTAMELEEPARCEDRDLDHVVDGTHHDNPR